MNLAHELGRTPRHGSACSGYGGLDLAIEQFFGAQTVWHLEYDRAPSAILEHHNPTVPNLHDLTKVDWSTVPPIDLFSAGYPCQPFSAAGRRKGTDDDRHLWPYLREAIRVLRPRYTVLENVAGHRSLGFDRVLGDMAEDGFDVRWTSLRASDIGAPHHRERLFILVSLADARDATGHRQRPRPEPDERDQGTADADSVGRGQGPRQSSAGEQELATVGGGVATLSDTTGIGSCERIEPRIGRVPSTVGRGSANVPDTEGGGVEAGDGIGGRCPTCGRGEWWPDGNGRGDAPDTDSEPRRAPQRQRAGSSEAESGRAPGIPSGRDVLPTDTERVGSQEGHQRAGRLGAEESVTDHGDPPLPDTGSEERARGTGLRESEPAELGRGRPGDGGGEVINWGPYADAVRRWERVVGPAPAPTEPNKNGKPRLNAKFAEWMMGLADGWVTDVPGLSRSEQLKAIGNGVVPQQALAALAMLLPDEAR